MDSPSGQDGAGVLEGSAREDRGSQRIVLAAENHDLLEKAQNRVTREEGSVGSDFHLAPAPLNLSETAGTVAAAPALHLQLPGAPRCSPSSLCPCHLESGEKSSSLKLQPLVHLFIKSQICECAPTPGISKQQNAMKSFFFFFF